MLYYFEIFKSANNGQYYFNIKASNGERVAQSEGYTQRSSALQTIESIKRNINPNTEVR